MIKNPVLILGLTLVGFGICISMPQTAAAGNTRVDICHIPPDNPDNFHTITVNEKAVDDHLAHGDLTGSCFENCEALCDDGNACTQDVVSSPDQCICQVAPGPAVSCDDSDPCTTDSCDVVTGCSSDAIFVAHGATGQTWAQAQSLCEADGLDLASIHSQEEQGCAVAALVEAGASGLGGFIGLHEDGVEGNWLWIDGTTFDFANWLSGEPNNDGGFTTNVVHIWLNTGGYWNDVGPARTDFGYVCR